MKLLATPIVLGGPGTIVQIDESLFNHKPKVKLTCIHVSHLQLSPICGTIEEELLQMKHGCSAWQILPRHQL